MYARQLGSASHSVVSAEMQAPPSSSTDASRHVSQASPEVVTVPFKQYSVAQAVAQTPLVPQSQAWMSAMRSLTPVT